MSTRSILAIALISVVGFTGCKSQSVYSTVYSNKKNSFKPPVVVAKNEIKSAEVLNALAEPVGGAIPAMGAPQNALPGIPGLDPAPTAPPPAADPAAGAAPAIPGL
jgi:hypothetical protein